MRAFLIAALLCAAPATAQQAIVLAPGEVLLTVQGRGEVRVAPDRATISGGVVSEADSARGAVEANSRAMATVVDAITKANVPSRAIRTAQVSVQPRYSEPPRDYGGRPFKREIVGFVARNSVSVELGDPARASGLFDAMTRAGANEVFGPNLSLADPSTARRRATELAVADAQRNAQPLRLRPGCASAARCRSPRVSRAQTMSRRRR